MNRFNLIFTELVRAGIPIADALETATLTVENQDIHDKLATIKIAVQRGVSLTEAFRDTQLYESMLIQMLSAGEKGGAIDAMLEKVTDYYKAKFSDLVDKISAIFRGRDFIDQKCSQLKVPTAYRNLRVDLKNHTVYRGEEIIALTRREYDLLVTLMSSNKVMSREQLLDRVWKYESASETNIVDVYIRYLRSKIDLPGQESYIKTSKNKLHMSLRISIISTLASMTILLYNFYTIVYISVLSNIVLVPIFSIILFPLVLISYIIFLLSVPIFNILCRPLLNFTFSIFDKLQEIFLYIKPLRIGKQSIFIIIVIFIVVVYIMVKLNRFKYFRAIVGFLAVTIILLITSYIPRNSLEELKIGKENIYYIRENRNNMIINTSSNMKNFYTDYRKKDRDYDIINEYDSLLNYEGKDRFNYLLLTSAKKNKSEYATNLLVDGLVSKIVVVDSVNKKLLELKDIAQYKKVDYIVLNNGTEMKFGNTSVYYYNKKVKVKNQDREFEIEVDD